MLFGRQAGQQAGALWQAGQRAGALWQAGQRADARAGAHSTSVFVRMQWPGCTPNCYSWPPASLLLLDSHERQLLLPLCRRALNSGASPDLAAALQGVTQAKLFLGGEVVRVGLSEGQIVELAAAEGISVVMPSGAGLGLVAGAAPAVQL